MAVLGVDGCARGWVGVILDDRTGDPPVRAVADAAFAEVVAAASGPSGVEVIAVDMPVGLSERGVRVADTHARRLLGARRASVFLTPVRQALACATYAEASARNREITGQGISRQAWSLAAKIAEVERWRTETGSTVWEVHPEVAFATLAGAPLAAGKRTWAGAVERRRLLAGAGVAVPDELGPAGALAAVDDVLDAAVVAWSARRIAAGQARSWPDPPERDHLGRPMAVWA